MITAGTKPAIRRDGYRAVMDGGVEVTDRLARRVREDFPEPGSASEVLRLLAEASDSERLQAAIVFTASGNMEWLRTELALAKLDWRDVLVNGGLADDSWAAVLDRELGPLGRAPKSPSRADSD